MKNTTVKMENLSNHLNTIKQLFKKDIGKIPCGQGNDIYATTNFDIADTKDKKELNQ